MADLSKFVEIMVNRGLGLYGQKTMAEICYNSGIALTDKNEIDWLTDNKDEAIQKLLVNYGERNLPAKMTAIVLARQHGIPVPQKLLERKKKKSRFLSRFRRRNS